MLGKSMIIDLTRMKKKQSDQPVARIKEDEDYAYDEGDDPDYDSTESSDYDPYDPDEMPEAIYDESADSNSRRSSDTDSSSESLSPEPPSDEEHDSFIGDRDTRDIPRERCSYADLSRDDPDPDHTYIPFTAPPVKITAQRTDTRSREPVFDRFPMFRGRTTAVLMDTVRDDGYSYARRWVERHFGLEQAYIMKPTPIKNYQPFLVVMEKETKLSAIYVYIVMEPFHVDT